MNPTTVQLGSFTFRDFEVPEAIPFGGVQAAKVHVLVGGKKKVDAMGRTDRALSWSGRFRGPDADDRVDEVDAMCAAGKPVSLTWGRRAYTVLILEFFPEGRGNNEIPYSITCEVITNDAAPNTTDASVTPTQMIGDDALSAASAASTVSGGFSLASVQSAVASVRDFTQAGFSTLAGVRSVISTAQAAIHGEIGAAESLLASVSGVGGVVPGLRGSDLVSGLLEQVTATADAAGLYDAANFLGRADKNLAAIGLSGAHVIVAGADLYRAAVDAYGDASEWATIANANGLTDPILPGLQELTIPPTSAHTGGVTG